ncbi:MAG TPA: hypothetical protein VEQ11_00090 [Chloroflexota bacterium]|nr:hypothetical protein [Chloroflexota bacterium]
MSLKGVAGEVYCSYFMEQKEGGLDLSSTTLSRLGALGLSLTIATYHYFSLLRG